MISGNLNIKAWIPPSIISSVFLIALLIISSTLSIVNTSSDPAPVKRVVVFSIDSAEPETILKLVSEGKLPGFEKIITQGVFAEGLVVAFPSATAVTHAVFSTGAPPYINGITGNRIHLPGSRIDRTVSGFDGSYLTAEPIWITLERQGMTSVVAAFPQSTPKAWADVSRSKLFNPYDSFLFPVSFSTLYTSNESVSRASIVSFEEASGWENLDLLGISGTPLEAGFRLGDDQWWILVYDSNGDGLMDKVAVVPFEKDASMAVAILSEGEWSPPVNISMRFKGEVYTIAPRFKAIEIDDIDDFRLYRSVTRPLETAWFNDPELARAVWRDVVLEIGMITGADWFGLTNGWFDEDVFMETAELTNEFFRMFTEYLLKNTDWNLLMTYTPIVDSVLHQFLGLTDPSMPYYSEETAEKYREYIEQAYIMADKILQTILDNVDLDETAVIVVSDHGQWSVKKLVYINSILYNAGLLNVDERRRIIVDETSAYYIGYNQIFINLKDREENGIVTQEEYRMLINRIKSILESTTDPDTGEPVFSLVITRGEAEGFGLLGERAGDIIFSMRPGYAAWTGINIQNGRGIVFVDAVPLKTITGWHSDLPYYKDLYGIFGAIGAGIVRSDIKIVRAVDIAPTISKLLGIEPPRNSVGIALPIVREVPEEIPTITIREVETITKEITETFIETRTIRVTETIRSVETVVETEKITTTVIRTETETVETPLSPTALLIIAIPNLLVGIAIGYILLRKYGK